MRTTLTLDDDVSARLRKLQRQQNKSLKFLVNEALRQGLNAIEEGPKRAERFRVEPFQHSGSSLVGSLDCVSEVLAVAEGESFK